METVIVTLTSDHARRLLEELQLLGVITIHPASDRPGATHDALKLDTRNFKFNRDEANER